MFHYIYLTAVVMYDALLCLYGACLKGAECSASSMAACSFLELLIQTTSHSTLHFLGSSTIHLPSVKSIGGTVGEIIEA